MKKEVSDLLHQVCKLMNVQYSVIILKESIRFRADNKRAVLEKIELL